jgi:NACHT domain
MKPAPIKKQHLLLISITALVLSVSLGPPSSQPTSPCEIIIQATAQKNAERDRPDFFDSAENKKKKSDDDRSNLSKDLSKINCTVTLDTWKIYNKKYDEDKYPAWLGIIIGGALLAVGKDTLQKLGKQLVEAIWKWLYSKFAGTKLFENIALKKYRSTLIRRYQELNIPLRPNRPLKMQEIYVSLKVAGISGSSIETDTALRQYRRLMVKGAPGSGKSMLLKYLALSYAEGRMLNLPDRSLPILLELNSLNDPSLTLKKLEEKLVEVCDHTHFPKADRFITGGLKDGRLMLLFDGLDEVSSNVRPHVIRCLKELLGKYQNCRAIITCRTAIYNNEFADITDQTLEVEEFNDRQIRQFLQVWKAEMPADKSVEQLIKTLKDRPLIMALARNPLLLTMIACLYSDTPFILPHSRAEFYTKATNFLLELRDEERGISNKFSGIHKRRLLQHLALYTQNNANRQQQDRRSLTDRVILEQTKQVLPSLNIDQKDADGIIDEIVKRSGLLLRIDGGERYQFSHLTLQEYFAASALVEKQDELIQQWKTTPSDWREVVKLWCGLTNDSTALIEAVEPNDSLTAFECLADAKEVRQEVAQRITDYFKTQLGQVENELIINAFGAVAADSSSPRGRDLFNFLVRNLDNTESINCRKMAAQSLAMTNLPQAVWELAERYKDGDNIVRNSLVKMGNLAVPKLKLLAEGGNLNALADLKTIATPEAAITLVPFLWNSRLNEEVTYHSAWHLGELLLQPEIEESLRTYSLTQAQKQSKDLENWIWKPFSEPNNSALPIITGRIAYLLNDIINRQHLHEPIAHRFIPDSIPTIDPRLMIPICSILSSHRVDLPKRFPVEAEALLERSELNDDLKEQIHQQVKTILGAGIDSTWGIFILSLPPRFQLDLLYRLTDYRKDFKEIHWLSIYKKIKFDFKKSLEYRIIMSISFLTSIVSIYEIFSLHRHLFFLIPPLVVGIATFPLFLLVEDRINGDTSEPILWLNLGVLGIWKSFGAVHTTLYRDRTITTDIDRAAGRIILRALIVVVAVAAFVAWFVAGAGLAASVVAWVAAWCFGFVLLYLAKENPNWGKALLSILFFPWFCWLPLVLCFTSLFLHNRLSWEWGYIILFWFLVIGLCSFLWQRGTTLAAKARNPLRGILEPTLIIDKG